MQSQPTQQTILQTTQQKPHSLFYQADDGIQLHYLFWPNKTSASCCLLIHGFTNDAHIWDSLAQKLQPQHNVIAVDLRGHGDSDWDSEAKYTHPQLLEDVYQLIASQAFSHWHIIGHSLGARIATLMLARKQFQAKSFTLIDTGPEVRTVGVKKVRDDAQNTPIEFASVEHFFSYLSGIYLLGETTRIRAMAQYGLKKNSANKLIPKTDPAFTAALWQADAEEGGDNLRYPLTEELWLALSQISSSTLILKGQASAILAKEVAEKMAYQVMPNAELKIINRAGHALMVDNPEEFEETVCQFIQAATCKP